MSELFAESRGILKCQQLIVIVIDRFKWPEWRLINRSKQLFQFLMGHFDNFFKIGKR